MIKETISILGSEEAQTLITRLKDILLAAWDRFVSSFSSQPVPFEEFLTEAEEFFDGRILETQKKENLAYIGGKLIFTTDEIDPNKIVLTADCYYKNCDDKWIKQAMTRKVGGEHFSDWDCSHYLNKLRTNGKLEFDIDPPKRNTMDLFEAAESRTQR